ncbi:MAG: OsmC family protein [Rhodothermales bacterium]|nr:OsmC family protein [Rhodothermales bacterium]
MDYRVGNLDRVRTAFERNAKALALRPAVGQGTAVTTVRVTDGLTCEIQEGDWRFACDLSEKHGGRGAGPNPGILGRGALGACLAMSTVRWAARLGVPLSSLTVEVEADYDARGEYGLTDAETGEAVAPGYAGLRLVVTVESEATEAEVGRVLDLAERHTPFLDLYRRATPVSCELWCCQPQPAEA